MYNYHCQYCNIDFAFQKPSQIGAHKRNCKSNPNLKEIQTKILISKKAIKQEYFLNCKKCGKPYVVFLTQKQYIKEKYKKYCSLKCANSRVFSQQSKLKMSRGHKK